MVATLTKIPGHFLVVASFGLLLLGNTICGELTYVGAGIGWDGRIYTEFVMKFCSNPADVFQASSYSLQRVLPSAVVAGILKSLSLPCDEKHIIWAFRAYNFVLLTASVYLWTLVSRRLRFSQKALWVSTALLFLSFPVQKQYIYFPVTTDATGLFLSVALFYCFLAGYKNRLLFVSLLGAFSWPMVFYTGLILSIWPLRSGQDQNTPRPGWAALVTLGAIAFSLYCFLILHFRPWPLYCASVIPLSLIVTALLLFGAFMTLIPLPAEIMQEIWTALKTPRTYALAALAWGLTVLFRRLGTGVPLPLQNEVCQISVQYLAIPGISLLGDIIYFGPVIFLALYRWFDISALAKSFGIGLLILFGANVSQLLLNSEARRTLVFLPFLVGYTVKALDNGTLSRSLSVTLVALSFLFSKIWFPFNALPGRNAEPMVFPLQAFMAHVGFMNLSSYVIYLGVTLLIGFGLPWCFPNLVQRTKPEAPPA